MSSNKESILHVYEILIVKVSDISKLESIVVDVAVSLLNGIEFEEKIEPAVIGPFATPEYETTVAPVLVGTIKGNAPMATLPESVPLLLSDIDACTVKQGPFLTQKPDHLSF